MSGSDHPPSLKDLDARLRKARGENQALSSPQASTKSFAEGIRLSLEMVAAVVVGGGIGWFLDDWLETKPLFLLIFIALGLVAGIRNVYQAANRLGAKNATKEEPAKRDNNQKG
ncbi:MAG: AtpZ/AtpI family protein [Proteobacteria bacterium]|nr:AtpZ/AtpI family protein [Pseudomonadota bacterium]